MRSLSPLATFKDHFSGHADNYATYRPTYPEALFRFLADASVDRSLAWDCATGTGQAARGLVPFFDHVVATDASATQIAASKSHGKLEFRQAPAEESGLNDASVDLLTVAQALHWFDIPRFLAEAQRVLRTGGLLAFWCYERNQVNPRCDRVITKIFAEVEDFWPPERDIVENHYRDIDLPMGELSVPRFDMTAMWSVDDILGYFRTWSATRRYIQERDIDPFHVLESELRLAWGTARREVRWPLTLRLGRK